MYLDRFYRLDLKNKVIKVYKDYTLKEEKSTIRFVDILEVIHDKPHPSKIYDRWDYLMKIRTTERVFKLYACCFNDQMFWLHIFHWITECNAYYRIGDNS